MNLSKERKKIKRVLEQCLLQGGALIRKNFGKKHSIREKGTVNIVTETDMAVEKKIISLIQKHFPDHRILSEESFPVVTESPYRWVMDPLDGTTNFAHHLPICCVSIAVEYKNALIFGGIYNPLSNEFFFAEKGKGATLNGKKIRVSGTRDLIQSLMVTGFPYDRQEKAAYYVKFFQTMMQKNQGLRRLGAAALDLAYVACGRFEAFWEFNLKPWDVAAGMLIVQEAGGRVTDLTGKPFKIDHPAQILASNGRIHSNIISVFKPLI